MEEEVSQSSAFPSDHREGNTYNFPFSSSSWPPLHFGSSSLWTGGGRVSGLGRGRHPGTQPTGLSPGSISGLARSLRLLPGMPFSLSGRPRPLVFKVL